MFHSHLREYFAIEWDILGLGESNKLGIGHPVFPKGVVETDDPERAEGALLGTAITPSIFASLNYGFFGLGEEFLAAPAETFGFFENIFVALLGHDATLDSSHTCKIS